MIRSISKRPARQKALQEYEAAKRAWRKEGDLCECCEAIRDFLADPDRGGSSLRGWDREIPRRAEKNPHHTRGRIGTLLAKAKFWARVCDPCHRWIGDHPKESKELLTTKGIPMTGSPWNHDPDQD